MKYRKKAVIMIKKYRSEITLPKINYTVLNILFRNLSFCYCICIIVKEFIIRRMCLHSFALGGKGHSLYMYK